MLKLQNTLWNLSLNLIRIFYCSYHSNATHYVRHRFRRSLSRVIDRIWQGFHFNIQSPSVDWRKGLGGSSLGASVGLLIKNILDLELSEFDSLFKGQQ